MMQFKMLGLISILLCAGCAQKERGTDITLASQPAQLETTPGNMTTGSQQMPPQPPSSRSGAGGIGLRTQYGGAIQNSNSIPQPATSSPRSAAQTSPDDLENPGEAAALAQSGSPVTNATNFSSSINVSDSKIPARIVTIARTKPGCKGEDCPAIRVKRLNFAGYERFNAFLDQTMASMAEVDASNIAPLRNLAEFAGYYWRVAKPRYEVVLEASIRRGDEDLVVVQLDSYIFTGGAHGTSTSQYINWLPTVDKILSLESMLVPGMMPAFEQALKKQHAAWLLTNPQAINNQAAYAKLWPFVPTDNAALLKEGLALTYDPYMIAPYSFGKPTLVIPYSELKGILKPEVLPK